MVIKFYNNTSSKLALDKNLINETTLNGTLREQTSLINPVFNIESNNVFSSNYCYIPDFDRYYYVTEIESVRQGLWRISLHVDVRSSFKQGIRSNTPVLERSQALYDLNLPDPNLSIEQDVWNVTKSIAGTFSFARCTAIITNSSRVSTHSGGGGGHDF